VSVARRHRADRKVFPVRRACSAHAAKPVQNLIYCGPRSRSNAQRDTTMNNKMLLAIPMFLIGLHGAPQASAQSHCVPQFVPPQCQPADNLTINTQTRNVAPPNLCAAPGQIITVSVVPGGSVAIHGKNSGWPNAWGSSFTMTAPRSGAYDYNVYFEDGGCIDPKITVD
jgi:hypothetical protein